MAPFSLLVSYLFIQFLIQIFPDIFLAEVIYYFWFSNPVHTLDLRENIDNISSSFIRKGLKSDGKTEARRKANEWKMFYCFTFYITIFSYFSYQLIIRLWFIYRQSPAALVASFPKHVICILLVFCHDYLVICEIATFCNNAHKTTILFPFCKCNIWVRFEQYGRNWATPLQTLIYNAINI